MAGIVSRIRFFALIAVMALAVAACGGSTSGTTVETDGSGTDAGSCATDGELSDVTILLPFPFAVPFFSVFGAEALDYFEDEGLNVAIETADGSASVVQQVAAGNVEMGLADPGPIIDAVAAGEELVVPYVYQTGLIYGLVAPGGAPFEEIADFAGETIGVSEATAGEVPFLEGLLATNGVDPDTEVQIVETGAGASTAAAFDADRIAAYFSDYFNIIELGFEVELQEYDLGEFALLHAASLVTSTATIDNNKQLIECVGRAMAKATEFTFASPEAMLIAIGEDYPDQVTDPEGFDLLALEGTMQRTKQYDESGEMWGWNRPDSWQGYLDLLSARGELTSELDREDLYTNDLVDSFNSFDKAAVRQAANDLAASAG